MPQHRKCVQYSQNFTTTVNPRLCYIQITHKNVFQKSVLTLIFLAVVTTNVFEFFLFAGKIYYFTCDKLCVICYLDDSQHCV